MLVMISSKTTSRVCCVLPSASNFQARAKISIMLLYLSATGVRTRESTTGFVPIVGEINGA